MKNYNYAIIAYRRSDTSTDEDHIMVPKNISRPYGMGYYTGGASRSRLITSISDEKVEFTISYENTTASTTACIPYKIYGVNLNL